MNAGRRNTRLTIRKLARACVQRKVSPPKQKPLALSSFVAVPVTALSAIFMGTGLFASSESGQKADHHKGADISFDIFHRASELRRFSANMHAAGAATAGRSALPSQHPFDVGVVTARAQYDLHVGLAPVAPVPAVIAGECSLQHTLVGRNPTTFLVAD